MVDDLVEQLSYVAATPPTGGTGGTPDQAGVANNVLVK